MGGFRTADGKKLHSDKKPQVSGNVGEESEELRMQREQLNQLQQHLEQLTLQEKKHLELNQGREDKLASTLLRALRSQALVIKQRIQQVQANMESNVDPYKMD
jgi:glutaredoxin 2